MDAPAAQERVDKNFRFYRAAAIIAASFAFYRGVTMYSSRDEYFEKIAAIGAGIILLAIAFLSFYRAASGRAFRGGWSRFLFANAVGLTVGCVAVYIISEPQVYSTTTTRAVNGKFGWVVGLLVTLLSYVILKVIHPLPPPPPPPGCDR